MKRRLIWSAVVGLLAALPAQAAQTIAASDARAVLNTLAAIPEPEKQLATLMKMESQLLTFSDGVLGMRFRYLVGSAPFTQRVCWFLPFDNRLQAYLQVIAAGNPVQSYTNSANGRWFVSNMLNATFSQSDLDWCTG